MRRRNSNAWWLNLTDTVGTKLPARQPRPYHPRQNKLSPVAVTSATDNKPTLQINSLFVGQDGMEHFSISDGTHVITLASKHK